VAVRASGGRAPGGPGSKEVAGRSRSGGTVAELSPAQLADDEQDDVGFTDEVEGSGPTADELTTTASRAPGAPASRGAPGTARLARGSSPAAAAAARPGTARRARRSGASR